MTTRSRRGWRCLVAALAVVLGPSLAVAQQIRPSQHGTVAQTIDSTTITIEYDRPVARGRALFPGVVRWGSMWTPGANWATTLEVDRPVHINGEAVPAGTYSMWMIPEPDKWTVILSRDARRFHTRPPSSSDEQARFTVKPTTGEHLETLTFLFPVVSSDSATLDMRWGTMVVPMHITVDGRRPGPSGRWGAGGAWSCASVSQEIAHEVPTPRCPRGVALTAAGALGATARARAADALRR